MSAIQTILKSCSGVRVERKENQRTYYNQKQTYTEKFFKEGEIVIPEDTFIKINGTATKGTIARVLDIEFETWGDRYPDSPNNNREDNELFTYDVSIVYGIDEPKKKGRINSSHVDVLSGVHETKYVREVKTHEKVKVKNPVNKFKQEMQRGDWVVGVKRHDLKIGRITRWTNHNVWAVTGDDLDDKSKEFKFDSISQTFTMPDSALVQELTMAVLKGWNGR